MNAKVDADGVGRANNNADIEYDTNKSDGIDNNTDVELDANRPDGANNNAKTELDMGGSVGADNTKAICYFLQQG